MSFLCFDTIPQAKRMVNIFSCAQYNLRQEHLRAFFHQTFQVYHVYCSFILYNICQITVILEHWKMEIFWYIFLHQTFLFATEHLPKWRRRFVKNRWRFFLPKAESFILFGLPNYVQILLACDINTYYGIINRVSDFRCQYLQR